MRKLSVAILSVGLINLSFGKEITLEEAIEDGLKITMK